MSSFVEDRADNAVRAALLRLERAVEDDRASEEHVG